MTDKPPPDPDQLPEAEANERFRKLVGNLVNTPHKPHRAPVLRPVRRGAPKKT